jgi:prophage DNA circulation protein
VSYIDRLSEMRYTSPSGKSFSLLFDDVTREGGKKVPVVEFPGQDQGAVQDLGELTVTIPVTCYIAGPDYDIEADRFWDALAEPGAGELDHPRWGVISVMPSTRRQAENFVDGASVAVFEITFIKADERAFEYPRIGTAPDAAIQAQTDEAAAALGGAAEGLDIAGPGERATVKKSSLDGIKKFRDGMMRVTVGVSDLSRDVQAQIRKIEREIDSYILAPAELMGAFLTLYRLPSRTAQDVEVKIKSYETAYRDVTAGFIRTTALYGERLGIISAGQALGLLAAAAEATTAGDITTRGEAARIVAGLSALSADAFTLADRLYGIGGGDVGFQARESVRRAVSSAILSIFERALNLPTEQAYTLSREITPIEIVFELDGDIERLHEFIGYNQLAGDEIILIPRGREVRWYAVS